ncbi:hypothetical protein [Klebsiella electrica]|uniref:hypothetical protein n=1 Tax=Klebsiella electrica TaxID=1259973 RepID=UPI003F769141
MSKGHSRPLALSGERHFDVTVHAVIFAVFVSQAVRNIRHKSSARTPGNIAVCPV